MPGLVVFGRRWRIASDDLVFPGAFELSIRAVWWIVTLVLYSNHKGRFDCPGGAYLQYYLIVLLVLLAFIILALSAIVYVSAQGSIMNPGRRRSMPLLVYVRALLYFPEFLWACVGAVWVSDSSSGCEREEIVAVIGAVVSSWVILLWTLLGVLVVFDPLGSVRLEARSALLRDLDGSESARRRDLEGYDSALFVHSRASSVWETRLRLLCCCLAQDDNHRAAFSSIAQLFSTFFMDTDLVPSDIAAGLALLHQEQDKMEQSRDLEDAVTHSTSPSSTEDLAPELEKAAHYMTFAAAAYGWPLYVYSNPLTGLCRLSRDCCVSGRAQEDLVGGDGFGCNFSSILQSTGLQYRDFIHISLHNQIYEIPFFVALDHQREAVLVSVRGTLSLKDVLTDLSAECENLCVEGVSGTCYAHKGISQAAHYIYKRLVNDGILSQAFSIAPEYSLVITGHSLGAGAAALLSVLLRCQHPSLQCYAFSPPGGLMSKALADYCKQFVVSVVLGKDLVPRLSIPNMEDLKRRLSKMVSNCSKPKVRSLEISRLRLRLLRFTALSLSLSLSLAQYQILLQGLWYELFGGSPDDFPTELENRSEDQLSRPLLSHERVCAGSVGGSGSYQSLSSEDSSPIQPSHLPLFLPGRILYLTEEGTASRRRCFSQPRYRADWASEVSFRTVLISPRMITDHMPDVVLQALQSLSPDQPYTLCSSASERLNVADCGRTGCVPWLFSWSSSSEKISPLQAPERKRNSRVHLTPGFEQARGHREVNRVSARGRRSFLGTDFSECSLNPGTMELEDVVLYQEDTSSSAMMSERVSALASSIYREFERMIGKYDEDVVKELMPLVVAVLENLDSVFTVNREHEVELELLKEDNEQLITQYEREKALRKTAEESYIAYEDSQEQERKALQMNISNSGGRSASSVPVGRLEEREAELRKEYNALHQRHTEMIHSYMEHLERSKHQQQALESAESAGHGRISFARPLCRSGFSLGAAAAALLRHSPTARHHALAARQERPVSLGVFSLAGSDVMSPDTHRDALETPGSERWRCNNLSHPRSNTSLQEELSAADGSQCTSSSEEERLNRNLDSRGIKPDSRKIFSTQESRPDSRRPSAQESEDPSTGEEATERSEVQDIIESTPELEMEISACKASSTPSKGVENLAFDRNTDSLFEELSSAGTDLIGDVDEGADLLGMGRENDLIARVDELVCEKDSLLGENQILRREREKLQERNRELEEEVRRVRSETEEARLKTKQQDDDSEVPTAQRKRFTRVEMARVLMERNQYKERLMELQEAVRWTEMIRASRESPALAEKKKSSIWQFFSRLFSPSSGSAVKKPESPVNVKFNAPSAQLTPSVKKKSSALAQLPGDKSRAFDFLNEESEADGVVSRREQKRAQYRQVKAHVQKEDGRMQAYGWSLPPKFKVSNGAQAESKLKNLPVPVYLRPLDETDASMKLWCAAGVNLSGGRTPDGGSMVGASVFYKDVSGGEESQRRKNKRRSGSQSSLERLEQELTEQQQELRHPEDLSSLVWICTSTHSSSKVCVIDANQPGNILESFSVCSSHVLCIASVPGARETDYPSGEDPGSTAPPDSCVSSAVDGGLGAIAVLGCSAVAPQTLSSAESPESEEAQEAMESSSHMSRIDPPEEVPSSSYTEHIFTDPLGVQDTAASEAAPPQDAGRSPNQGQDPEQDVAREEVRKMSSALPTMWLGAQNGCVYVHSSVAQRSRCLHSIKLKDSVLGVVHLKGRVLVALADGTLAIFHRAADGQWDLSSYHLLDLGRPHHSIRCMVPVHEKVWCGYRNKIFVVQPRAMKIEKSFDAHPRKESQVRQLACLGDGVWVSIRLDSTLRLFHAHTHQHLQDVDIEPYVSKMLGTGKLGFSFVRITALMVSCSRLWVGTGNGVIISIPLSETVRVYEDASSDGVRAGSVLPFCSMAHAQLCFHGHRDAVKFFTAVPGQVASSAAAAGAEDKPESPEPIRSMLVMSGGEGYIDFRMDHGGAHTEPAALPGQSRAHEPGSPAPRTSLTKDPREGGVEHSEEVLFCGSGDVNHRFSRRTFRSFPLKRSSVSRSLGPSQSPAAVPFRPESSRDSPGTP
ncbi:hypothetical protein DNTS_025261, partial [Danionella cerebrum]